MNIVWIRQKLQPRKWHRKEQRSSLVTKWFYEVFACMLNRLCCTIFWTQVLFHMSYIIRLHVILGSLNCIFRYKYLQRVVFFYGNLALWQTYFLSCSLFFSTVDQVSVSHASQNYKSSSTLHYAEWTVYVHYACSIEYKLWPYHTENTINKMSQLGTKLS